MSKIVWLMIAGATGTVARYSLVSVVQKFSNGNFPYGTLAVNVLGCFLAGLIWTLFENRFQGASELRIIVLVGFVGAFTTFSAYILDTGLLTNSSGFIPALLNIAAQNLLGVVALVAGIGLARIL